MSCHGRRQEAVMTLFIHHLKNHSAINLYLFHAEVFGQFDVFTCMLKVWNSIWNGYFTQQWNYSNIMSNHSGKSYNFSYNWQKYVCWQVKDKNLIGA